MRPPPEVATQGEESDARPHICTCLFRIVVFPFLSFRTFLFSLGTVPANVIGYTQVFEFGSRDEMTGNLVQVLDLTDRNINLIDS